ncbi:MAG: efflux RND transporter permease subunit ['Candidatus Kapabacteria' thiocyanatum]|uniref:Multidrug transporter AcrB n=1 Tax=Candidatus Kapaibacterium thiocyanatum TaxID=1895771 RepID=A0A1M3KXD5_9BACT|nr:efflux RND transporter permease subunit ['Candidatus Kapabacteria' thiocyanatum]OJX57121.1 MAG: multidrug transporter AcrB ['Candidatus Kapabacteria' thiocyanatum]
MNITRFSVENYRFTLVMFIAVLALGITSLLTMPRSEDPDIISPQFAIVIVYPGTTPSDMEQLVVDPFEKKINELDDIKRIKTDINDGLAVIQVEYKFESNADDKYQEIVREVNSIRKDLPADINSITIRKFTPTDVNILQFALVSESVPYSVLQHHADELKDRLEKVRGLKNIDAQGFPDQQVQVELNLDKMAQMHVPTSAVLGALQSENVNMPGGSITAGNRKFNVKTSGDYGSLDEIAATVIASTGGSIVRLSDVASVTMGYEDETHITRLDGHRCVFVTASQKSGQNIIDVRKDVEPVIQDFRSTLPASVDFLTVFDQTESVSTRLLRFAKDFSIAILLVLITLLPLGFRASVVVMISIPLSLSIGLTLLNLFGFNINQLSIVGMIVALGILVDDSIVVVENIERFLRMGVERTKAAIGATSQISLAVLGCTVLLMFAFLPLMFLPEAAGAFIRSLPMAVITTVFASMVVSLTVVPFLASHLLRNHGVGEENFFLRGLKKIISGSYSKVLDAALHRPKMTLVIAFSIFAGAIALVPVVGFSLFPKSEKPMFLVNIEMPNGTNIHATNEVTRDVERVLRSKGSVIRNFSTNVGKGNPRIYYNVTQRNEAENFAQIFVQLQPETGTKEKIAVIDDLRERLNHIAGVKIEVKDFEQGPPIDAPLAYRIYGEDLDTLRAVAARIETLLKRTGGTLYVNNPLSVQPTDARIRINKDKAGMLGIPTGEIDRTVRLGIAGLNIGTYRNGNEDEMNINVSIPHKGPTASFDVFDALYVQSLTGTTIPLRNVTDVEFETSPNLIRHYDKERTVTVSSFLKTGYNTARVNAAIVEQLRTFPFPTGVRYQVAGEQESRSESFSGLGIIILVTVFGFIAVLILEFKTFKSIAIVLSVIPLGIIGAVAALLLAGETFSFTATIGMIALVGIEVKNSLLLVDFTNQLRAQGKGLIEAIQEAGEIRFVPIVLTSLTAIGGLLPLVIEYNQLYSPLAIVIIGGLVSSTLLSRLVTPVMYLLLPPDVEARPAEAPLSGTV